MDNLIESMDRSTMRKAGVVKILESEFLPSHTVSNLIESMELSRRRFSVGQYVLLDDDGILGSIRILNEIMITPSAMLICIIYL